MKYLLTLALFFYILIGQTSAQLSADHRDPQIGSGLQKGQHQLGLITDLNGTFLLSHRFALKENLLLRTSFKTPNFSYSKNSSTGITNTFVGLGVSLGIEKHILIGKKWSAYYGAEVGIDWGSRINSYNVQTINISGLAGLKFNVNDRLSLFTEVKHGYNLSRYNSGGSEFNSRISSRTAVNFGVLITLG